MEMEFPGLERLIGLLKHRPQEVSIVELPFDWATPFTAALTAGLSLMAAFGGAWYAGRLSRKQADAQYQRQREDYNLERASNLVALFSGATTYISTASSHIVTSNRAAIKHGNYHFRWSFVRTPIMSILVPDEVPADCAALLLEHGEVDLYEAVARTFREVAQWKLTLAEIAQYRRIFDDQSDDLTVNPISHRGEEGLVAGLSWSPDEHPAVHRVAMILGDLNSQLLTQLPSMLAALGDTTTQINAALEKHKDAWGLPDGYPGIYLSPLPGDIAGDPAVELGSYNHQPYDLQQYIYRPD